MMPDELPYDEMMRVWGKEHRRKLLSGLIVRPNHPLFLSSLKEADDWFREHGIDPETIRLTPEEIENAKIRKKELEIIINGRQRVI